MATPQDPPKWTGAMRKAPHVDASGLTFELSSLGMALWNQIIIFFWATYFIRTWSARGIFASYAL